MHTPRIETSAELRRLYAEAEARATRLRVLLETSRVLATAHGTGLDAALALATERAALLAGFRRAHIVPARTRDERSVGASAPPRPDARAFPLVVPGDPSANAGVLVVESPLRPDGEADREDLEAVALIAQLMGAALAARRREERLAELLDELLAAQERERAHVARELHDGVAQVATAALRRIELAAQDDYGRRDDGRGDVDTRRADARRAAELTRELVTELRRVIAGMRPTALDDLGLAPAVAQLAERLGDAGYDVRIAVAALPALPPVVETGLFRLVQESLANVRRHAGPCRVDVALAHDAATSTIELAVRDAGRGFDPGELPAGAGGRHFGLAFMAERARALGGRLRVEARPGAGCAVLATVPVP